MHKMYGYAYVMKSYAYPSITSLGASPHEPEQLLLSDFSPVSGSVALHTVLVVTRYPIAESTSALTYAVQQTKATL